ncbi:MAG: hypothetical protein KDB00_02580 [Planctomycetales bacterium]|nr:hypothetical protein [Planctomycetales bacterium]
MIAVLTWTPSRADSAIDLLSGFDEARIAKCYPVNDSVAAGEMAKLLFRLRKADHAVIKDRSGPATAERSVGDVVEVEGTISVIRQYKVPEALVDFLELATFQEIVLQTTDSEQTTSIFSPPLVGKISKGDLIRADAIAMGDSNAASAFAAGHVQWIPATAETPGWRLLAREGVDLSRIAEAASRNRRPLEAADGDAFYSMLTAAKELDIGPVDPGQPLPPPETIKPVALLEHPGDYHGQWIRIRATTVRITRVTVTDPNRREQLGQDYYYQVDSSGDLGNVIVQLERPDGESGEPIQMSGSYPVSLVTAELPNFLRQPLDAENAVVSMISQPVSVDGFFYRLWSYENEFMTREGGGKQVGPLIVVSHWRSLAVSENSGGGVQYIGYALAAGIFAAILGTILWTRRNAREDAKARESAHQPVTIDL